MILPVSVRRLNAAYRGRAADEAYLEFAQEHFLHWLLVEGLTDGLVFKGGTCLRKHVFGLSGRFSRDLDFGIPDRTIGDLVIDALSSGFTHEGVTFRGTQLDREAMKTTWWADTPGFGPTALPCRLDFSTRTALLPPIARPRAHLPGVTADNLGFTPVVLAIADLRETMAEKLARFRRVPFARDTYDIAHLAPLVAEDTALIREMLFFKVYFDVVDDGRGERPFLLGPEYCRYRVGDLRERDELGATTAEHVNFEEMLLRIQASYGRLTPAATSREQTLARCSPGDRYRIVQWAETFSSDHRR